MHIKFGVLRFKGQTCQIHVSDCVSAPRLPRERQQRLPALSVLGHCAGEGPRNWKLSPDRLSLMRDSFQLFLQAFFSSLSGTLATRASLRGVGVGNQEATVAAATMTWLLKGDP